MVHNFLHQAGIVFTDSVSTFQHAGILTCGRKISEKYDHDLANLTEGLKKKFGGHSPGF